MAIIVPLKNDPKCCSHCPCAYFPEKTNWSDMYCQAWYQLYHEYRYLIGFEYYNQRAPWCPLIFVEEDK